MRFLQWCFGRRNFEGRIESLRVLKTALVDDINSERIHTIEAVVGLQNRVVELSKLERAAEQV